MSHRQRTRRHRGPTWTDRARLALRAALAGLAIAAALLAVTFGLGA